MTRAVMCASHSIEEFDMLKLYARIGVECFSISGYVDPRNPHDEKRPAVPEMPFFAALKKAVDALGQPDNLAAAQSHIPDALLDWLGDDGAIVFHHRLEERLIPQWPRLRDWMRGHEGRRVIWRSVGQSVDGNEARMRPLIREGVERVAYSPKEQNIPGYTGHAALIRFYKDPAEWYGWTGSDPVVLNITQHASAPEPASARDVWVNWRFWEEATRGLPAVFAGPGSERRGGLGTLSLEDMKARLRSARVYLYTGTQPASYTLGLIEALMTGTPVVSIAPQFMRIFPYGLSLFEGHEIAGTCGDANDGHVRSDEQVIANTRQLLRDRLDYWHPIPEERNWWRERAIELFGIDTIAPQWAAFLGVRVPVPA